jgi:hypothetical protein
VATVLTCLAGGIETCISRIQWLHCNKHAFTQPLRLESWNNRFASYPFSLIFFTNSRSISTGTSALQRRPFTQLLGATAPWTPYAAVQLSCVVERFIMVFIPSHPTGDDYIASITRPWIRLRASSLVKSRYRSQLPDFLFIAGDLARPADRGEMLLRFRVVKERLKVETYVSKCLRGSDLEFSLSRLAWHFELAWNILELLRNEK